MIPFAFFRNRMLSAIGELVIQDSKPRMRSRALEENVSFSVAQHAGRWRVTMRLPFYWAVYVHDGRGEIQMPRGRFMVFFPNSKDDPRLAGGHPRTREQVRHLTKEQFRHFLKLNRDRTKVGLDPIMVIASRVDSVEPNPFFKDSLASLHQSGILHELTDLTIRSYLQQKLPLAGRERVVIRL